MTARALLLVGAVAAALAPTSAIALADLVPFTPFGWDYPVVPRAAVGAVDSVHLAPAALPSDAGTHWNYGWGNVGTGATSGGPDLRVYLEDYWFLVQFDAYFSSSMYVGYANVATTAAKGGRHTVFSWADWADDEIESDETNNTWARQFIWSPLVLPQDSAATRTSDPVVVSAGSGPHFNAEGFAGYVDFGPYWYAFAVLPLDPADDFDVRLNTETPSNIPQAGFGAFVASSMLGADEIDFVIVNANHASPGTYYASALNWSGAAAGNKVVEFDGDNGAIYGPGTYGTYSFPAGSLIELHDVLLSSGGETRIQVSVASGDADIGLSVYDASGLYAGRSDFLPGGYADNAGAGGDEFVIVDPDSTGYYGVAVWKTGSAEASEFLAYDLVVSQAPNLAAGTPAGWYGPVVPRNTTDAGFAWAPLPGSLVGNQPTTSFNFSILNEGANGVSGSWEALLLVDDAPHWPGVAGAIGSGGFAQWINTPQGLDPASLVRGGRHHVRLEADVHDDVVESFETDNRFVDWFVWTPLSLADQVPVDRGTPPWPVPTGWGPWYSCDGLRVDPASPWTAVGILPLQSTGDPDLFMHAVSTGSKDGFGASLAASYHNSGETDFVIVNRDVAGWSTLDFGVFEWGQGGEFLIERADGPFRGAVGPAGASFGPFEIEPGGVLDFHTIEIDSSALGTSLHLSLDVLAGNADVGVAIYDKNTGHFGRSDAIVEANAAGGGGDEHLPPMTFSLAGAYGVAVFKTGYADSGKSCQYRLVFSNTDMVDAPLVEAPPDRFALGVPRPNPFGRETRFRYDVPAAGGFVSVSVFDVQGRRVATLVEGVEPPGRHTAFWRGTDQAGRTVGPGIYFVRLDSPTVREVRKVTLLR